jgi:hypothetical protein
MRYTCFPTAIICPKHKHKLQKQIAVPFDAHSNTNENLIISTNTITVCEDLI